MTSKYDIGLTEAISITLDRLPVLKAVDLPVDRACGLVAAEDCYAVVDCPSRTASLKDGYAVIADDIKDASENNPVRLKINGMISAGDDSCLVVQTGVAIKVMTGASIPEGADAIISVEFTTEQDGWVICRRDAGPGRNILIRGSDVEKKGLIVAEGNVLSPAMTGLVAAGGVHTVRVYPRPRVGVISTGSEVVAVGGKLAPGQLYASNMVTLISWLSHFRMDSESAVVPDHEEEIRNAIDVMLKKVDVLLTSGGAWKSERDMTARILVEMGGDVAFHRVRLGPGKAVALIFIGDKVVFCLPGGPPSNEMAFFQIALPGLLHMSGRSDPPFECVKARLSSPVGGDITWTQVLQARLKIEDKQLWAEPLRLKSRLKAQAIADALIMVPEGVDYLNAGDEIDVQVLRHLRFLP